MDWALPAALVVAAAHVAAPLVPHDRRTVTAAAAAGISVAHTVVGLLPELAHTGEALGGAATGHVLALAGLVVLVGAESLTEQAGSSGDRGQRARYGVHFGVLLAFNAVAGFELIHAARAPAELALYVASLLVLTVIHDEALGRESERFRRSGRWWLAGAVVAGCLASGVLARSGVGVDDRVLAGALALVVGALLAGSFGVLRDGPHARFAPFALSAAVTAGVTVAAGVG